ncbi:MAG: 16S rRNA (cytosine(1402)-N(4))-methyltransferase RsmH [Actinomycetota bacterium]|nr:16S rRNA (cytosine(1402)-N(4))-methyltransferase RsmH [Actinomycetota bacterium]
MADEPKDTGAADVPPAAPAPDREFRHDPVMIDEVTALVGSVPPGTFVDGTVGGGGHAERILETCPQLRLLGIDRDPLALDASSRRLARFGARVDFFRGRFDRIGEAFADHDIARISGFLFDLGVSSPQLDWAQRGFSYRHDGPLDMRMDTDAVLSAADIVNSSDQRTLASILRRNADERFATRIAAAIIAARPFTSTVALADVVVQAIPAPARRTGGHPAKRTFQALRIAVNDELDMLVPALEAAIDALVPGGRGLVLTYHSGEDRLVKDVFRRRSTVDIPPGFPVPATEPEFAVLRPLARRPQVAEQERNRRAASARLRGIERRAA